MPFLTIITPIFNRAYIIRVLYQSLCCQTDKDFEWLIVDDGSTDNIDELVATFVGDGVIDIRYLKKKNGGKHTALNYGICNAKGQLSFIVDSDDYLTEDAVEWIHEASGPILNDSRFAGLSGIRIYPNGNKIGGGDDFGQVDANALDIRFKYGIKGDLAEVFKTEILRKYPFPEINGELFCPEALIWNRIADKYLMRYFFKGMYVCEYLEDGLTSNIIRLRRNSPNASMTYYSELFHKPISLFWKIRAAINFWRFASVPYQDKYSMCSPLSLICWIPGIAMRFLDKKR